MLNNYKYLEESTKLEHPFRWIPHYIEGLLHVSGISK